MAIRIEISSKIPDTRAAVLKKKISSWGLKDKIKEILLIDVYTTNKKLSKEQVGKIADSLHNPVNQNVFINQSIASDNFNFALETGFLPGVTDNIGNTAKEIVEDLLNINFREEEGIYSSRLLLIKGKLLKKDIEKISQNIINPLIQRVHIKNKAQYKKENGMDKIVPKVKLTKKIKVDEVNLDLSDEDLISLGKLGIKNKDGTRRGPLALDLAYLKTIQKYFKKLGRKPTDIEIESIAQTWSEHCKHTIFADPIDEIKNGLFNTYIKAATDKIRKKKGKKDFCVSVFKDNSGAIEFDDKFLITHKAETHNSPSALDPFGGSITGIVGVNRDTIGFGMGAKPIINTYGFCFADPKIKTDLYKDRDKAQKMLSPKRILEGVIEGVNVGGNCSGIPTPQGFVFFNNRYQGKPLVFVGTVGLIPKKTNGNKLFEKKALSGDYIVMVGGRVGQDGIHGATFSSEAMDSKSPATAVQIGDPITQKKLSDAIVKEARDRNLYSSITDNGAGGISCSVAEMAKESGGCTVNLDKVPLKYPGLELWQTWISESQERMTLSIPKNKWKEFKKLMDKRGVEATIIGEFNSSSRCIVKQNKNTIMDIDMKFLHDGLPKREMKTKKPNLNLRETEIRKPKNQNITFLKMLSRLNIAGFEFISSQYDYEVQGNSVLKPLQGKGKVNSETSAVKPLFDSKKGVLLSQGLFPNLSEINSYSMAGASIDLAIRNIVAAGGDINKIALLDNFCWCSPNNPERLYQLREAARGCFDFAVAYEAPFISGKDSMFNDFKGYNKNGKSVKISVPPTLLISSIGIVDDVTSLVSLDFKFADDYIYVLGETNNELAGSEYLELLKVKDLSTPKLDPIKNRKMYIVFAKAIKKNLISSSIAISRGGIGTALAKSTMAGFLGVDVSLKNLKGTAIRDDFALYSESLGRILISVAPKNKKVFERIMKNYSVSLIGKVTEKKEIRIRGINEKTIINILTKKALNKYKGRFKKY